AIGVLSGINYNHTGARSSDTPIPGGDALVIMSGGTHYQPIPAPGATTLDYAHQIAKPSDPPSASAVLSYWEDEIRRFYDQPASPHPAGVKTALEYLLKMHGKVVQEHPEVVDYKRDITNLHARITTITGQSARPETSGAPCISCDSRIVQHWEAHGLSDTRICTGCKRTFTPADYDYSSYAGLRSLPERRPDAQITEKEAALIWPTITPGLIRKWNERKRITPAGRNERGHITYRAGDIQKLMKAPSQDEEAAS
ncbi:MAG TPA: hypothetical protein VK054_10505, partial [Beutenbergiaceae bacterium]|nr:hypothetical protein [Beutenbergiaceae bacterium]